ncbi:hypothetical protein K474DRAFT_1586297, partial [Panus rudis PR-1116 ss-1]
MEVWRDADATLLPSWIGRLPTNVGSSQHGKLSADQYRSLCTIYLVKTLTRLWGSEQHRNHPMLVNYLSLVTAINLAHKRCLSRADIKQYRMHMHHYLRGIRTLYPYADITPNQHLSLHLADVLERFGPVHAWRCFPFERYNGMLQDIPTNNKFGELEATIMKRFCIGQNLRALATVGEIHEALKP